MIVPSSAESDVVRAAANASMKTGVPMQLLLAVGTAESGLKTPKGWWHKRTEAGEPDLSDGGGPWGMTVGTAKGLGFSREQIETLQGNADAAASYLKEMLGRYGGNQHHAAMAYRGPGHWDAVLAGKRPDPIDRIRVQNLAHGGLYGGGEGKDVLYGGVGPEPDSDEALADQLLRGLSKPTKQTADVLSGPSRAGAASLEEAFEPSRGSKEDEDLADQLIQGLSGKQPEKPRQLTEAKAFPAIERMGSGIASTIQGLGQTIEHTGLPRMIQKGLGKAGVYVEPPRGNADQLVQQQQAEYEARRAAAGNQPESTDWWRLGGEVLGTLPLAAIPASSASGLAALGAGASAFQPVTGKDFWKEKAMQAAGGAALGGALGGALKIPNLIFPKGSDKSRAAITALESSGVTPTVPLTGGRLAQMGTRTLENIPVVSSVMKRGATKGLEEGAATARGIAEELGGGVAQTPFSGGTVTEKAISRTWNQASKDVLDIAYKEFDRFVPLETTIMPTNTLSALDEPLAQAVTDADARLLASVRPGIVKQWSEILSPKIVGSDGQTFVVKPKASYGSLKRILNDVQGRLDAPALSMDIPKADLIRIKAGIQADIKDMARAKGPEAVMALENATKQAAQRYRMIEDGLGKIFGATGEEAYQQVLRAASNTGGDLKKLNLLKMSMPEDAWNKVASAVFHSLGQPTPKANEAIKAVGWSPSDHIADWGNLSDKGKDILFGKGPVREMMDNLVEASQLLRNDERTLMKTGGALGGIMSGVLLGINVLNAVTAGIGAYGAAKLMQSPAFARWMTGTLKISQKMRAPDQAFIAGRIAALQRLSSSEPTLLEYTKALSEPSPNMPQQNSEE